MERHDVVCLGEALVDFLPDGRGKAVRDVATWTPHLGGAPANVAVGVARLGASSALVAVTGADEFGHFLLKRLRAEGVDTRFVRQTTEGKTGLGFVSLTKTGERSFTFYRQRPAESFLAPRDTRRARSVLRGAGVLHAGTNSLLQEAAREAMLEALEAACVAGRLTSCDPNLRLHLWPKPSVLRRLLGQVVPRCAVLKLSEEEIHFVTGTADVEAALAWLERRGVVLPIVTLGRRGAALRIRGETVRVRAPRAKVVDTTGAGDGFTSGLLFGLTRCYRTRAELERAPREELRELAAFACVVGSRVVEHLGAVAGLPRAAQVRGLFPGGLGARRSSARGLRVERE